MKKIVWCVVDVEQIDSHWEPVVLSVHRTRKGAEDAAPLYSSLYICRAEVEK